MLRAPTVNAARRVVFQQKRSIYAQIYAASRKAMPKVSDTERQALEAGTVGFDRELFSGSPNLSALVSKYKPELTKAEQSFMDNEVNELCEQLNDYQIQLDMDLPPNAWTYIKEKKFMGMIVPEKYGGLGFSAFAHGQVVQKVNSRSPAAAVTVMVPNSLGPAELINKYGTQDQRDFYLPRLAIGQDVPCFALTGMHGSDAASMTDKGIVMEKNGQLGIELTFEKRYITLSAVATVAGLALILYDPNKLLKGKGNEGITVCLLKVKEAQASGLQIGGRHNPLGSAFVNGTLKVSKYWIPMTDVIGGQPMCGKGWGMLMECLAEGRGISLPATSTSCAKLCVAAVGSYARMRKQFKVPLAEMEGVQEKLANICSQAFIMTAAQHLMCGMLNKHEKPSVLSAVMKYQLTERARIAVNEGMDVMAGAAISLGPNNIIGLSYIQSPIAITVEGANVLTRSLIVFGQGLIRSHPHLLKLIDSIGAGNDIAGFKTEFGNVLSHVFSNMGGSVVKAVTHSRNKSNLLEYYESNLDRLANNFAICADMALALGGALKGAQMVAARYADILANLYLGYACLWYQQHYKVDDSYKVLDYSMANILYDIQESFFGLFDNFPNLGIAMRYITFPYGRSYDKPSDKLRGQVARLITTETPVRELLTRNIFISKDPKDRLNMLHYGLKSVVAADKLVEKIRKEKRKPTPEEEKQIKEANAHRQACLVTDSFIKMGGGVSEPCSYTIGGNA